MLTSTDIASPLRLGPPALPPAAVADALAQLRADPALDVGSGVAIARGNALRLFPTLTRRLAPGRS
ncbi:hypothetical protein AB1484_30635 [Parafrankia sp. FMc6]|uniref:hypothetical protein n=1 Tax=Parafrankia soli TaxID=2599596 RepID=UPI0034D6D252